MADGQPQSKNTTELRKNLVKAMVHHTENSVTDRNVCQAFHTLTKALYNVLACRPFSEFTHVDESTLTQFHEPARMKDLDTTNAMVKAYMELLKASKPFDDVFVSILGEFGGNHGEGLGQYMTPPDLADLTAEIAAGSCGNKDYNAMRASVAKGEPIRIADPTGCGTGGLLLAQLRLMVKRAPELLEHVEITGVDIDVDMVRASTVQVVWNCFVHRIGLKNALFYRANAITEYHTMRPTFVFAGGAA